MVCTVAYLKGVSKIRFLKIKIKKNSCSSVYVVPEVHVHGPRSVVSWHKQF